MATAHHPSSWSNPQTCADHAAAPSPPPVCGSATVPSSVPRPCACQHPRASPGACPAPPAAPAPSPAETQWLWGSGAIARSPGQVGSSTQVSRCCWHWDAGTGLGWMCPLLSCGGGAGAGSLPCAVSVSLLCLGPAPSLRPVCPTALPMLPMLGEINCNKPWSQTLLPCAYLLLRHCTEVWGDRSVQPLGWWTWGERGGQGDVPAQGMPDLPGTYRVRFLQDWHGGCWVQDDLLRQGWARTAVELLLLPG